MMYVCVGLSAGSFRTTALTGTCSTIAEPRGTAATGSLWWGAEVRGKACLGRYRR